jgi:hypothetical protein
LLALLAGSSAGLFQLPVSAAQNVALAWDASPDPDVAGYKLYFGQQHLCYDKSLDAGNTNLALISLPMAGVPCYLAATTYDAAGNESDFSDEVIIYPTGTTALPALLTLAGKANGVMSVSVGGVSGTRHVIEASTNLSNWVALQTNTAPFTFTDTSAMHYNQRFYRSYAL